MKWIEDTVNVVEGDGKAGLSPNATTYNVLLLSVVSANDLKHSWSL